MAYADADGDLFLVDRIGELILVNGFNVYPHEVELVLAAHPGVAEAAVIGVDASVHRAGGEGVRGAGARRRGHRRRDLLAHCERNLARFKCPTVDRVRARAAALGDRQGAQGSCGACVTTHDGIDAVRLTLITRAGCHLCDVAKEALDRIAAEPVSRGARSTSTADADSRREYGDRVPVVLLDGKEHGYWRVEEERLLRDLARRAEARANVMPSVAA